MGKTYVRAANFKTCHVDNKSLFSLKVIQPSNSGKIICGKNQYTIVHSTGTVQSCLSCETCHKGLGLYPECGSTLLGRPITIECRPCKPGTFSSEYDSSPYKGCHQCAEYQIEKAECTNRSDTVCTVCSEKFLLFCIFWVHVLRKARSGQSLIVRAAN